MAENLIRKRDARKILGIGETTLDQLIERGLLPVVRFTTRSVRIRESEIAELIERWGECHHYAGQHSAACQYLRRTRRPRLTRIVNRVALVELLALFISHRAQAVRIARGIVGDAFAEDCASEAALYLIERRVYLRRAPSPAYFFTAVRHTALRVLRSAWHRHVVAMDSEDLIVAEQAMVAGKSSDTLVRLPEPVEASSTSAGKAASGQ